MESAQPQPVSPAMIKQGIAARPILGQTMSGDAWLIHESPGTTLIAVIDGLGHGPAAYDAAQRAYAAIMTQPEMPLTGLMQAAHTAAQGTRGVVAGLLRLHHEERTVRYVGVGNIGIHVVSKQTIKPISRNGTVGYRLPTLFEQHATFDHGDLFIMFSDGVSMRFADTALLRQGLEPQHLADRLMADYGKTSDDATVVVVQTLVPTPPTLGS